jgi:exodeoxyribonuclease VII large subunit
VYELSVLIEKLELVSPMQVLKRGYSITKDKDNKILKTIKNISNEDNIVITLSDGYLDAKVINIVEVNND